MAETKKIVLGKRPASFNTTITVPMLEGGEGAIPLEYKYRTRLEFAEFMDGVQAKAKARGEAEVEQFAAAIKDGTALSDATEVKLTTAQIQFAADYIMDAVKGWGLDVEFSRDAVIQLADELPLAITTIIENYRAAVTTGRLGNFAK
jgi:hypothetical protein